MVAGFANWECSCYSAGKRGLLISFRRIDMKLFAALATLLLATVAFAQDKPRVFVQGHGTLNSTTHTSGAANRTLFGASGAVVGGRRSDSSIDSHDESIELTKDLRANCPGVVITLKEDAADYVVMLNRESKAKVGLIKANSQVLVANKQGDVIWTKDVRQVMSAAKDACAAIVDAAKTAPIVAPATSTGLTIESATTTSPAPTEQKSSQAPASKPNPQQKYIRVVNGNGTVMFIPECVQTTTGSCK